MALAAEPEHVKLVLQDGIDSAAIQLLSTVSCRDYKRHSLAVSVACAMDKQLVRTVFQDTTSSALPQLL